MAFWNDPASIKPKQLHRWVVSFGEYNSLQPGSNRKYIPLYLAKSIDLPSYEIGNVQARYLFSYNVNYPKRLAWKPITITLYDAAINVEGNKSTQGLLANPASFGYVYESTSSYTFKDQVNSNLVGNGQIVIKQLTPDGSPSDSWKLYNAILSEVKFDRLDYSSEAIQTVTLTINYDDAKLETDANKEDDYVLIDKKFLQALQKK